MTRQPAVDARPPLGAQEHAFLAVDVIVLTLRDRALKTLLVRVRDGSFRGEWAFPGGLVAVGESLEEAAARQLGETTGLAGLTLEQLRTFGSPTRDPHVRVVSTAYLALAARADRVPASPKYAGTRWVDVRRLPRLAYDHDEMARVALERLRARLAYSNIVYGLLPEELTLGELQEAYETILGAPLDRRNFRKKILSTGILRPLGRKRPGVGRPAALYGFLRREPMTIPIL